MNLTKLDKIITQSFCCRNSCDCRRKGHFHALSSKRWRVLTSTSSRRQSIFWWRILKVCQWLKEATPSRNIRCRSSKNTASMHRLYVNLYR